MRKGKFCEKRIAHHGMLRAPPNRREDRRGSFEEMSRFELQKRTLSGLVDLESGKGWNGWNDVERLYES